MKEYFEFHDEGDREIQRMNLMLFHIGLPTEISSSTILIHPVP